MDVTGLAIFVDGLQNHLKSVLSGVHDDELPGGGDATARHRPAHFRERRMLARHPTSAAALPQLQPCFRGQRHVLLSGGS